MPKSSAGPGCPVVESVGPSVRELHLGDIGASADARADVALDAQLLVRRDHRVARHAQLRRHVARRGQARAAAQATVENRGAQGARELRVAGTVTVHGERHAAFRGSAIGSIVLQRIGSCRNHFPVVP